MTDIGVFTQPYLAEDRSWLLSEPDNAYQIGGTLSIPAFTQAVHYPNGYIPSGTVVGLITASGLYGPYDDTATDGRQTAVGVLFGSIRVLNPVGGTLVKVGGAFIAGGSPSIATSRLPFNSTNAATGRGYIDAAGQVDLKFVQFFTANPTA
ncbi:MAG: head decoration protein [Gemmatimonadaceae bacterium]